MVRDGFLVASQGPGTAIKFALKFVELLMEKDKVLDVNTGVLARID